MTHITRHREGFGPGRTVITSRKDETGIGFSILALAAGENLTLHTTCETALLHLSGTIELSIDENTLTNQRHSLFDEPPFALHCATGNSFTVKSGSDAEFALFETENPDAFPTAIFRRAEDEHRGRGLVGETALRYVRTIFDNSNSHPKSRLVLGEVVNFPGRWSSYPPHHHPQPEIYHYRFTNSQGYGHAELGDAVFKVRPFDTLKITDNKDHAQCAAPGYGMYYIWVIRHLEALRYTVPEFTEEHRWTMEPDAAFWNPLS